MKWQNIMTMGILGMLISFVFIGCYTTLLHPKLEVADETGAIGHVYVEHMDNCNECHQGYSGHSMVTGLGAAAEFDNWRFYYEYPWWIDEYHQGVLSSGSAIDMPEARDSGRRRNSQPGNMDFPTTSIAPAPAPVLTKTTAGTADNSSAKDASSQDDSRRSVGRRKHDTSGSKKKPV